VINVGIVQGSKDSAKEIIVGYDTVYVHSDIEDVSYTDDRGNLIEMYKYNEVQYGKDEYIELLSKINKEMELELIDTQMALCEVYELLI
jgi:hypothetical protein